MSQCFQECIIFLSPIYPDIEFHTVQRYCKVTNEGPRYNFFGFEEEQVSIEEVQLHNSPELVDNVETRVFIQDAYVIKVWAQGEIVIADYNLPMKDNLPVVDK